MDKTGNPKFTTEIAADTGLEFLDLELKINESNIGVDVYPKSTNSLSMPHQAPNIQKQHMKHT